MSDLKENKAITGGEFIIRDVSCDEIFTPEDWTEEHLMMKQTAKDFINSRVVPNLDPIDNQEEGLMPKLLEESGE
ncbi:MAG: acyl-CoA dehydrogenase, partial [Bacteroidetes bacterium]|nr:acyl-CoA dehydrogenase [Bacteroidota bacterium]